MSSDPTHAHVHGPEPTGLPAPRPSDPAQESLVRALRASFNILRVLMVVLVVLYILSGLFRVQPGEQGLVARFGELRLTDSERGRTPIFAQGWHLALPDPFDRKYVITGQVLEETITTFLFSHEEAATTKDLAAIVRLSGELNPGTDGAMLTGDRNLSHGRWEVQYRIDDAALFVQHVGERPADFTPLLKRLTETAVIREVAGRTIEQVTRTALDDVRQSVQRRLQQSLDNLNTGVQVVQVVANTIEPGAVREAFVDVVRAENERLSLQERAEEEATQVLNQAAGDKYPELLEKITRYGDAQLAGASDAELQVQLAEINAVLDAARRDGAGQVAVKLSEAVARADRVNESLRSEFKEFTDYLAQRAVQPRITLLDRWAQMRADLLGRPENEIIFVPETRELEIHVKSDVQRQLELQEQRALKRQ
ncbi:MAG TPA: SPFH domain-containing protein [Phycisphaerae bacterium]|nr:SPFH domain-containing protein [Phycisphaerae bacterium]